MVLRHLLRTRIAIERYAMNVMAVDLELNQPSGAIIELGICIGDVHTGTILERKGWDIFVPEDLDPIAEFITQLTGITQERVNNGVLFLTAYNEMVELYKKHNCTLNMVTWGGGDHRAIRQTLHTICEDLQVEKPAWEFGHREFDVKTIFLAIALAQKLKVRSGLAKSMTRVGLAFEGTKHTAPDDAYNTFRLLVHLIRKLPKGVVLK